MNALLILLTASVVVLWATLVYPTMFTMPLIFSIVSIALCTIVKLYARPSFNCRRAHATVCHLTFERRASRAC